MLVGGVHLHSIYIFRLPGFPFPSRCLLARKIRWLDLCGEHDFSAS